MQTDFPDARYGARELFDIDCDWSVPGFTSSAEHVPRTDGAYRFQSEATRAILAGFLHNRRVLVQGFHGTGKSTHIEQVAARLKWPCIRVNLDGQVSRMDLLGKDGIVVRDGRQVTEFQPGILTWAFSHPVALVLDEYDAARPDVMFVIQRALEQGGALTLLDQNKVISPHPAFRLFATANTIGLGDAGGLYSGAQVLNQGQLDRWDITVSLNYLSPEEESAVALARFPQFDTDKGRHLVRRMIQTAGLTREGFMRGDLSTVMSPRTVLSWIDNYVIFGDAAQAFRLSFLNRSEETEREILAEYFFRCMGEELAHRDIPA